MNYFCNTCHKTRYVSPGGHGTWFPSCCWHNERIIWDAHINQWVEAPWKHRLPFSLAAKCSAEGLADYWKKEVQEHWWAERQAQLQKEIEAGIARRQQEELEWKLKHPARKPRTREPEPEVKIDKPMPVNLPIWWKYLKKELVGIRDLNRRKDYRWRNYDWARERVVCIDSRMIRGGEQRFTSNRKAVIRELRNYYDSATMCGAF